MSRVIGLGLCFGTGQDHRDCGTGALSLPCRASRTCIQDWTRFYRPDGSRGGERRTRLQPRLLDGGHRSLASAACRGGGRIGCDPGRRGDGSVRRRAEHRRSCRHLWLTGRCSHRRRRDGADVWCRSERVERISTCSICRRDCEPSGGTRSRAHAGPKPASGY